MNKTETKNSTTKRLTLTRRTLRTVTTDELRLVAGGAQFRSQVAAPGPRANGRVPGWASQQVPQAVLAPAPAASRTDSVSNAVLPIPACR